MFSFQADEWNELFTISITTAQLADVCVNVADCTDLLELVEIPVQTVSSVSVPACITVANRAPDNQYF